MVYLSKRDQVNRFIETYIIPGVNKKDLDYYKIIDAISAETGASFELVQNCLTYYKNLGKYKEIRVLTIPDEKIGDFLLELKKKEAIIFEADKEMCKIELSAKQEEVKK